MFTGEIKLQGKTVLDLVKVFEKVVNKKTTHLKGQEAEIIAALALVLGRRTRHVADRGLSEIPLPGLCEIGRMLLEATVNGDWSKIKTSIQQMN